MLLLSSVAALHLLEGLSTRAVLQGTARSSPSKQHQIFCCWERKTFVPIMTNTEKMWILRESLFSNTGTAEYQMQSFLLCVVIGTPGISDGSNARLLEGRCVDGCWQQLCACSQLCSCAVRLWGSGAGVMPAVGMVCYDPSCPVLGRALPADQGILCSAPTALGQL